jgi:hypothetical protein
MGAREIQRIVCPGCSAFVDVGDDYCRRCGVPVSDRFGESPGARRSQTIVPIPPELVAGSVGDSSEVLENRILVLMMLFLALGPLALPMLWRSRGFSPLWKVLLTAIVTGLFVVLLFLLWLVVAKAVEPFSQLAR